MRHSLLSSPGSGVSVTAGQNPPCGHVQSPVTGLEPPSQCRPELWTAEHSTASLTDHNSDPTVPSLVRKRSEDTEPVSKGGRPSGASVAVAEDGARLPGPHRVRPADEARCPALGLPRAVPSPPRLLGPQVTRGRAIAVAPAAATEPRRVSPGTPASHPAPRGTAPRPHGTCSCPPRSPVAGTHSKPSPSRALGDNKAVKRGFPTRP